MGVKLAQYVKPYVNKNDAAEAAQRPRFAALKSKDAQGMLSLHRTRKLLVKQRTDQLRPMRGVRRGRKTVLANWLSGMTISCEARLTMKTLASRRGEIAELEKALRK